MGKQQSKSEETIVVQNAAGGNNNASVEELKVHVTTTNVLLAIIVLFILLVLLGLIYKIYRRCHVEWITREIQRNTLQRSIFRRAPADRPGSAGLAKPNLYPTFPDAV